VAKRGALAEAGDQLGRATAFCLLCSTLGRKTFGLGCLSTLFGLDAPRRPALRRLYPLAITECVQIRQGDISPSGGCKLFAAKMPKDLKP
jgi:hypothetical protein